MAEIIAGRDPRVPPNVPKAAVGVTVSDFLDVYFTNYVEAEGLRDPPYLTTTPFHRFGVNIKAKDETQRDRRIGLQEEQALLAGCSEMNGAQHRYVGASMHDRLIGALETCCRQGEMLRIQIGTSTGSGMRSPFRVDTRRTARTVASRSIRKDDPPRS